jgi:hypothetical protein
LKDFVWIDDNGGSINGAPGYIAANAIADDFSRRPWGRVRNPSGGESQRTRNPSHGQAHQCGGKYAFEGQGGIITLAAGAGW